MNDRKRWAGFVVEGAVIVGSILLAFTIDRAYESYKEREGEHAILVGLRLDFEANREELRSYLESYTETTERIVSVVEYIQVASQADDLAKIGEELSRLYDNPTFDPYTATLGLIESSGSGNLLSDLELQTLISEWRTHMDDASDQQSGLQRNRETMLWPALVSLGVQTTDVQEMFHNAPQQKLSLEELRERELPVELSVYAALVDRTHNDLVQVRDATEKILERLDLLLGD